MQNKELQQIYSWTPKQTYWWANPTDLRANMLSSWSSAILDSPQDCSWVGMDLHLDDVYH